MLALFVFFLIITCTNGHQPVFQAPLNNKNICTVKNCKFEMVIRNEMSMTEKTNFGTGRVSATKAGETFLLDIAQDEGTVLRKLGNYYATQADVYSDLNMTKVQMSENAITADGTRRKLVTINGVFPGPTFEVMEGAEVTGIEMLKTGIKQDRVKAARYFL